MDERSIYEALGITPPDEGGNGQDGTKTDNTAGQAARGEDPSTPLRSAQDDGRGLRSAQDGAGAATSQALRASSPERRDKGDGDRSLSQPAADSSLYLKGSPTGTEASGEPEDGDSSSGEDAENELTPEQRRQNAERRRRAEQKEAVRQAVQEAVEREKARQQNEWAEFFRRANLKNTVTGAPIKTLAEFNDWESAFNAEKLQRDLKAGKLTPEGLSKAISDSPEIKQVKAMLEKDRGTARPSDPAAAQARIEREIEEIHKLDPSINSTADLLTMPNAKEFYEYVRRGNSFIDAYYLANRERLTQRAAEAAKAQSLNAQRSKEHLQPIGAAGRGKGAADVPAEVLEQYHYLNPNMTDAQIREHYNKYVATQR